MNVPEAAIEAAAEALDVHRWKDMGVSSVSCECGEILHGDDSLTKFPADEAFRAHMARAAIESAMPAIREALAQKIRQHMRINPSMTADDALALVLGGTP